MLAPAVALAFALAPTLHLYNWSITASGAFDGGLVPNALGAGSDLEGGGSFGAALYTHSVEDDPAAPALQPFLQRVGRLGFELRGLGASVRYPQSVGPTGSGAFPAQRSYGEGDVRLFAEGYVLGWIYVGLSARLDVAGWHDSGTGTTSPQIDRFVRFRPTVWLGGRWRDLLVQIGWGSTSIWYPGFDGTVGYYAGVRASIYGVVRQQLELSAWVELIDAGAAAGGAATLWLGRRIGIGASLDGEQGRAVGATVEHRSVGGSLGLTTWVADRWAIEVSYAPRWTAAILTVIDNVVTVRFTVRGPGRY